MGLSQKDQTKHNILLRLGKQSVKTMKIGSKMLVSDHMVRCYVKTTIVLNGLERIQVRQA